MDTSNTVRWRKHLWLVFFGLFVFWYLLLYVHDWSSLHGLTPLALQDHINSIRNPNEMNDLSPNDDQSISSKRSDQIKAVEKEKSIEKIDQTPVGGKELESAKESKKGDVHRMPVGDEELESAKERKKGDVHRMPVGDEELESAKGREKVDVDRTPVGDKGREKHVSPIPSVGGKTFEKGKSSCSGRYIYVQDIPKKFNDDLIENCQSLNNWSNMCDYLVDMGLGQRMPSDKVFSNTGWFVTNQFSLEVIFHNRMKQYECLTNNSSKASVVFVPYYTGLDVARYLWGSKASKRDSGSIELFKWLREQPEWKPMSGRDHFLVVGRITWDFRRGIDEDWAWGSKLMLLPESQNMTILTIESSPWNSNDFAIPYPTYFHPSSDAGGFPMAEQDEEGEKASSVFCLQPQGDSFTRRSTFDSIMAGCIPVFFHPGSAYIQYLWHLPKNFNKYSVLIPENDVRVNKVSIEAELEKIPKAKVVAMREEAIKLIPKVIYADPRSRLETLEDAFDLTVKGVLERIEKLRGEMREVKNSSLVVEDECTWKYNFFGRLDNHEWDHFF
ncbi:exostosin family protein [Actinidia rufa]|uniref:Exostosin family protein n=1 Tax=Actinidia rufa TaxID=165716 RepID=A0A7J0H4J0_9ERIC|nr:exostosin family protein [Actinidia rufa]